MEKAIKEYEVCNCDCHKDGVSIMHFMPCCSLCGLKYIGESNGIDIDRWSKAFVKRTNFKPTYTIKGDRTFYLSENGEI